MSHRAAFGRYIALLCIGGLTAYAIVVSAGPLTHGFAAYFAAARLLVEGSFGPLVYDDGWFSAHVQTITRTGVLDIYGPNLPTMALLALPIGWLDPAAARTIWLLASLAALAIAAHGLIGDQRLPPPLVLLILFTPPVLANLRTAQAYVFVLGAYVVVWRALDDDRDGAAGFALGLTIALKSAGVPLLLICAAQRRWRVLAAAALTAGAAALIVTLVGGWQIWPTYLQYLTAFLDRPSTMATAYQTTNGFARRLCEADARWNPAAPLPCASAAPLATAAILIAAVAFAIWRVRGASAPLSTAVGVTLSVLVVPLAEDYHFVVLAVPMVVLWRTGLRSAPAWTVLTLLIVAPPQWTWQRFQDGWWMLLAYPRLYASWLTLGLLLQRQGLGARG